MSNSRYAKWEGDVYRIDDVPSGFKLFVLKDGSWVEADGRLIPSVDFEGMPIKNPVKIAIDKKQSQNPTPLTSKGVVELEEVSSYKTSDPIADIQNATNELSSADEITVSILSTKVIGHFLTEKSFLKLGEILKKYSPDEKKKKVLITIGTSLGELSPGNTEFDFLVVLGFSPFNKCYGGTTVYKKNIVKEIQKSLVELLRFGNEQLARVGNFNYRRRFSKASILYFNMGSLHAYELAILKLLEGNFVLQAQNLIRTMLESYINIRFVLSDKKQENAIRLAADMLFSRIKWLKKMKSFLSKNPNKAVGLFKNFDWDCDIAKNEQDIQTLKKRFPHYKIEEAPKMIDRAKMCGVDVEWIFHSSYHYFSCFSHNKADIFDDYLGKPDEKGASVFLIGGKIKNKEAVLATMHAIYCDSIKMFMHYFKLPGKRELTKFKL